MSEGKKVKLQIGNELDVALRLFESSFMGQPTHIGKAPGRVNLLGEHTDYSQGFCLPMAIELYTYCCIRRDPEPASTVCQIVSSQGEDSGICRFAIGKSSDIPWVKHIAGVAYHYALDFPIQASFSTNIPLGGGLSSSAALEVAFAIALEQLLDPLRSWDPRARALLCVRASHDAQFSAVPCGILDPMAVSLARAGHLLFLDCQAQTGDHLDASRFFPPCVLLITNSLVTHSHAMGKEYKARVEECGLAARQLGVTCLREVTHVPATFSHPLLSRRATHVVTENARCVLGKLACAAGDAVQFGRLMNDSHASLKDNFEVSCEELDFLVFLAQAQPLVYGARMTGGGFGGCIITLCAHRRAAVEVEHVLATQYEAKFGKRPISVLCLQPGAGATVESMGEVV